MAVPVQQGNARGDAIPRMTGGVDQALRGRLTRGAADACNARLLQRDPGLVTRKEMAEAVAQGVPQRVVDWFSEPDTASTLSKLAIATELFLAVALWSRHARVFALWWGLWFHLVIEATSRVEGFTWLTLAVYALFATPDVHGRKLFYDASRARGRCLARAVSMIDWFARFEIRPWAPDGIRRGHAIVIVRRDGTPATGIRALAMVARCTPLVFPLWGPLALLASFTERGEASAVA